MMRVLGQNPTNTTALKVLGNPKRDDMNVKVLYFEHILSMLHTGAKHEDQGSYGDWVKGLRVFDKDRNGTIMGAEICHVLVWVDDRGRSRDASEGHEDRNDYISYKELVCVWMVLNG
ncbi:myosin light polypeptide 6-like [Apodemus sylvaticus]|uniref:myosin light polypeptide 6-like n=1 Tax=Apodemus sylvaticus TaxID=10129 RepID=UPI002243CF18|nr:myosin light polypeptide 6-like [Apodemus sylvaticus]